MVDTTIGDRAYQASGIFKAGLRVAVNECGFLPSHARPHCNKTYTGIAGLDVAMRRAGR